MTSSFHREFAQTLCAARRLTSTSLVDALAIVPRERFLGAGPWFVKGERDPAGSWTPDDDPRHVSQDVSVAIDASRDLYNGAPGLVASWLDALAIAEGDRVVHIGCGTGYYSAIIGQLTGPTGRVTAIEADAELAGRARANLAEWPWIEARHGDGRSNLPAGIDVLIVHAGASHVLDEWLDPIRDGGRVLVPLTCTMPGMSPTLSKGAILVATRDGSRWSARMHSMVMIYALTGVRNEGANRTLGAAFMRGNWDQVAHLDRTPHDPAPDCWCHGPVCLRAENDLGSLFTGKGKLGFPF